MQTNLNGHPDKYGVTASFRIPADLKREISDEAAVRGISFAQYGASILMSSHKHGAEQSRQVDLLLKERIQLQEQLAEQKQLLTAQSEKLSEQTRHIAQLEQAVKNLRSQAQGNQAQAPREADKLVLAKLQKNRAVLEQFLAGSTTGVSISKTALQAADFDLQFATSIVQHQGRQYICVYDVCYHLACDNVLIDTINPKAVC